MDDFSKPLNHYYVLPSLLKYVGKTRDHKKCLASLFADAFTDGTREQYDPIRNTALGMLESTLIECLLQKISQLNDLDDENAKGFYIDDDFVIFIPFCSPQEMQDYWYYEWIKKNNTMFYNKDPTSWLMNNPLIGWVILKKEINIFYNKDPVWNYFLSSIPESAFVS